MRLSKKKKKKKNPGLSQDDALSDICGRRISALLLEQGAARLDAPEYAQALSSI